MDSLKLWVINLLLRGLTVVTLRLLFYQAQYLAQDEVNEVVKSQKFDLRGMSDRLKNVMLHDQDVIDKRRAICNDCEFKMGKNCRKCGCFIAAKTKVATARCPIGKWEKEYKFIEGKAVNGIISPQDI